MPTCSPRRRGQLEVVRVPVELNSLHKGALAHDITLPRLPVLCMQTVLKVTIPLQDRRSWSCRHLYWDSRAISNCKIIPRPGKTYSSMNREIRQGKIKVSGFETIAFLLGTNDIDGAGYCKFGIVGYKKRYCKPIIPKQLVDMDTVKRDFLNLMDTVRSFNSTATIVICGLLPRLGDWAWSKEFSFDMNNFLQVWCC